jgi:hypothetical protein
LERGELALCGSGVRGREQAEKRQKKKDGEARRESAAPD